MISPGFFSFFQNFDFLGSYGGGVKGQAMVKMRNNFVCHAPYLVKHALYDFHL